MSDSTVVGPNTEQKVDRDKLQGFSKNVADSVVGGLNCALTFVGDQLGLYAALKAVGPANSTALAEKTNLSERWVREWLYQQSCIGQVSYDENSDMFFLTPEAQLVLVESDHPAYMGGMLQSVMAMFDTVDDLPDCFRSGIGQSFDAKGEACACGIERMSKKFQTSYLVPNLLPVLDGVVDKLQAGALVGDVGCGAATSTVAMAKAFPNSTFIGYDISMNALTRARANIQNAGISNVTLANPIDHPLSEDGTFDFITTFDVVHDSTHPDQLLNAIRKSLKADGTWLCADIKGRSSFAENLKDNPMAAMAYSFSVMVCMSAGLSVAGGAGLGTLGFHEQKAREMSTTAGFSRFDVAEYDGDAFNAFYEIRP
jgi:ubiquinone/menaquinone biosynthesis C-methylase UbiE